MSFEGSEKKLELIISPQGGNLRELKIWESMVGKAKAKILNHISNDFCDAYLLSESSLFVWKDRFIMITCGVTTLVKAAEYFLTQFPEDQIQSIFYERKNEYFPHSQETDFYDDSLALRKCIPGQSFRLGEADGHHLYLYHGNNDFKASDDEGTVEILMYGIEGGAKTLWNERGLTKEEILEKTGLAHFFKDCELIQSHLFDPCGFSLNVLQNSFYYTIHVTPQEEGAYVSFETNAPMKTVLELKKMVKEVLEIFQPQAFDVVTFNKDSNQDISFPEFCRKFVIKEALESEFLMSYYHFYRPVDEVRRATLLQPKHEPNLI